MLTALCVIQGFIIGQAVEPTTPADQPPPSITLAAPVEAPDTTASSTEAESAAESTCSIFSRPPALDRASLSFVFGSGAGRFNIIDWESRPNGNRYWWLGRWSASEEVQLHMGIGFNVHWWSGPVQRDANPPPDLPPQVFDLYLDLSWSQRWSEHFTSQVRFRPGMYTDFETTPPDSFRVPGEAVGIYQIDPKLFVVGGFAHVQRNDIKVLPIAGLLWQPTPRWELGLVFPEPRIAYELSNKHNLWGYIAGEYGGGRWTYCNNQGRSDRVEYSDFRVMLGIECRDVGLGDNALFHPSSAFFEMGYVFERRLVFADPRASFEPEPAWMIRFGRVW